ncbi:tetratricopeptide repeat protein [Porphyromonas sp. oral taxon 278]|uniref:tetratricopeptide repeat protein n=1 Tax=Porphyromonas sp. oral taxon 278 TaxID=712437 RepID=UPI0025D26DE9|nr:tetratricopeptide repeat protein [Porphyromonas sp. oral taxon 278]
MDLTILGEYGLKTALNVGLRLKKLYSSEVDDGIIAAFEFALNDWSKHTPTTSDKVRLSKALEGYIQSSTSYEALDADTRTFIDRFKKRLSEQPAAHNYLMTLRADMQAKSEEQNLLEHHKTQESVLGLRSRMEELNMAPQYIRALLKELPLEQGLECTESALEEMLTNGRIHSEGAKRLVLEFVRFLFEHTDKISEETKLLREAGDSYLAETLEEIKRVLTGESEQSLTDVHKKYQEQARQDEIRVLKELIEAAQIQFSFGEAREFYERLIELAPTTEHHFNYACLLQSLNDFEKAKCLYEQVLHQLKELSEQNPVLHKPKLAITLNNLGYLLSDINDLKQAQDCYEAALKLYQELSEQNPEIYKPHFAGALNNLGGLCQKTQDLKQAQAYYEDALKLRQKLSDQNPEAYKPYVAMTLNDLGNLHTKTNDLKQAQACYTDALKLYKELSKENPEAYKPDVAMTLNNLGNLFRDAKEIKQAKIYYTDALKLYQDLLDQNAEAYKPYVAGTLNNLGCLLSEVKDLKQAQSYYTDAFKLYKDLSDQNPEAYNPCMAMTLNNLGNLFSETKDLKQAQFYYMAAFKLYKDLSDQNPEAYKPYVAMALNNLILLYLGLGKKKEAEKTYQEAHNIYQDLASRHPRAYEIDYAKLLVMGFALLGKPKEDLEEAKAILDKYPEHPKAQELLSIIEQLDNR